MFKKLLVFSLAFCLGLIAIQFLKSKSELFLAEIVSKPTTSNNSLPAQSFWQISVDNKSSFENLISNFQNAVAVSDSETVISLINFPIEVELITGKNKSPHKEIKNEKEFLLNYDKIFADSFKKCISQVKTDKLLFSTTGQVLTWGNEIRMQHLEVNGNDFEVKIVRLLSCRDTDDKTKTN